MFTGIIKEIGTIENIKSINKGKEIKVRCKDTLSNLKCGDSVAVDGVCLTVTEIKKDHFLAYTSSETLNVTTLKYLKKGDEVNLEPALKPLDTISGHFVQGHIEGVGEVVSVTKKRGDIFLKVKIPNNLMDFIVLKGSIALSGLSLTVSTIENDVIGIVLIPFTLKRTTFKNIKKGTLLNIETDILIKSIKNLLEKEKNITLAKLIEEGY